MFRRHLVSVVIVGSFAGQALALAPDQVFDLVSPSVWAVRGLDATERPFSYGSGVAIGPERLITNCHVLARAKAVQVRRENVSYEAKLEYADPERDLCTLTIKGFSAPAVRIRGMADLKVGQRVYAVGNPERLALTLSEGLISGLRSEDPRLPPIQTSAPISQGSSGGGLFDAEGRLIGITTLIIVGRTRIAQNLNFAMPAEWIAEVPERAKALLAARKSALGASAGGTSGAPGLPAAGATYRYQWADRQYSRKVQQFTVQVTSVDEWNVSDSFKTEGSSTIAAQVPAREPRFVGRRLAEGESMLEFAPYLPLEEKGALPPLSQVSNYESNSAGRWDISADSRGWDQVTVPSGTYRAMRVDVRGSRQGSTGALTSTIATSRFEYTAWYAPDVKRYVRVRHQRWNGKGASISDESIELIEYRPN
jgi:S1-C subfamily serine protease